MTHLGHVESLWRYPVKSMRGEALDAAFFGFPGVYGDRLYAFTSPSAPKGFPYHTGREQEELLLYTPKFRHAEAAAKPVNLEEAEGMAPGITPQFASLADLAVDVTTPGGAMYPVGDPALISDMRTRLGEDAGISFYASERPLTDCRPVSLFSLQTVQGLAGEIGQPVDKRQFRANIYAEFLDGAPFSEKSLVGKRIKIGDKVELMILANDPRCKMITLDPDTAEAKPAILRRVTEAHDGHAGLYAAVLVEGMAKPGDAIVAVA